MSNEMSTAACPCTGDLLIRHSLQETLASVVWKVACIVGLIAVAVIVRTENLVLFWALALGAVVLAVQAVVAVQRLMAGRPLLILSDRALIDAVADVTVPWSAIRSASLREWTRRHGPFSEIVLEYVDAGGQLTEHVIAADLLETEPEDILWMISRRIA